MNNTEEVISRIDKYLSLMRYKYALEEQLSRQTILLDYYASTKSKPEIESFKTPINVEETLSKDLILPLKVKGVFLTEGKPKNRYYSKAEILKSVGNPINKKPFPLMLDHKRKEVGKIIGTVTKVEVAEIETLEGKKVGIRWWGHINDETFARNVLDGVISEVSATIFADEVYHPTYGKEALNLTFKELSLVMEGAESYNSIEVDK